MRTWPGEPVDVLPLPEHPASPEQVSDGLFLTPHARVGTWLNWWDEHGPGPAWAQMNLKTTQELALTSQALTEAGIAHHSRQQYNDVLIPLAIPMGAEQETVETELLAQVHAAIAAVDVLAVEVVEDVADAIDEV